ncbi:hypothetical protein QYE76_032675 [Lolium multiflorum]|uniref:Uncharacterized protein n=1 Tax=Lolium multiflorum TaxID=4521 RepID=A0AAD8VIK1_LOLMU|nr:hypothetical protein QYE76_032675 [Lolium multiflorum]
MPPGPHLLLNQVRYHLVPANLLPPLGEATQVRGARPPKLPITARRRISFPLQKPKTPAPATLAPVAKIPGGRNLWFLPFPRRRRRPLPPAPRPCRKLPCRQPLLRLRERPRTRQHPRRLRLPASPPPRSHLNRKAVHRSEELAGVVTAATSPSFRRARFFIPALPSSSVKRSRPAGRITELNRGDADLGHLLDYAEKWNQADLSPATRGLGKDKLPVIDPAGPRSTGQHFGRLRRAVKEFDTAWHDANNNVVGTLDTRKQLFEELLWEHRFLADAHSKCQAEKEQLIRKHQEALDAQKEISRQLKDQAIQAGLRHDEEMRDAKAAAEAKLAEVLEESANANAVLLAELEEEKKARKAAEHQIELMTDQVEYDRLVMQAEPSPHAVKKVAERRAEHAMSNPDAPWDAYDHLVALAARIQHMRAVDRHLVDLPDVAIQIFKVLWPGEAMPANAHKVQQNH